MLKILLIAAVATVLIGLLILCKPLRVYVQRYHAVLTILFALVGGFYVLLEYWDAQEEGRLKQTLSYVQRVQSGDVADARRWFDEFWLRNVKLVSDFRAADSAQNPQEVEAILRKLVETAQDDEDGTSNIMRMFYFYADLASCTNLGICDKDTACSMFEDDIANHYFFFSDFLDEWIKISFGGKMSEIEKFISSC